MFPCSSRQYANGWKVHPYFFIHCRPNDPRKVIRPSTSPMQRPFSDVGSAYLAQKLCQVSNKERTPMALRGYKPCTFSLLVAATPSTYGGQIHLLSPWDTLHSGGPRAKGTRYGVRTYIHIYYNNNATKESYLIYTWKNEFGGWFLRAGRPHQSYNDK